MRFESKVGWQETAASSFIKWKSHEYKLDFSFVGTFSIWLRHRGFHTFNKMSLLLWAQLCFFVLFFSPSWLLLRDNKKKLCKYVSSPHFEQTKSAATTPWLQAQEMKLQIESNKCLDWYATRASNVSYVCLYRALVALAPAAFMDWAFILGHKSG